MRRIFSLFFLSFAALAAPLFSSEESSVAQRPVSVEVIAEDASIQPGSSFWVALHFKLDPSWVSSLSKNVIPFAKLGQDLDKMLGRDEIVSITKGGFLGFGATTTTTTVRKMQDLSIVNRVVSQMGDTASYLLWGAVCKRSYP